MDNNDLAGLNSEIRELRNELREQSAEILELRMSAGDLKAEMNSLRLRFDSIRDLPLSLDGDSDLKTLLDHYLEKILMITDAEAGSVILVEGADKGHVPRCGEDTRLAFYSCIGSGSDKLRDWHFSGGEGIAGWVARNRTPYFADDMEGDPRWSPEVSSMLGLYAKDIICVPMSSGGRVIGVIEALNKKGSPFTREDLNLVGFIAAHASVMVENSVLVSDYGVKVKHLSTLMELSNLLNSSLRQDEVRRKAMEAATRLMDAEVGSLLLVDERTGELYFEVALGDEVKQKKIKEIRLKPGEGIAGWVAGEATAVVINDVRSDPRFFKGADDRIHFNTRNMVCVPVITKGRVIGVLQAINKAGGAEFIESDKVSLEALANQVAIAIENSSLYDQLRRTFMETSETLADAIEKRDPYTGGHTRRVLRYCRLIAGRMGMTPGQLEKLELAAVLHDVGKIGVSDQVLGKQGPLDEEEFASMKRHPLLGAEIMSHVPALSDIVPGIKDHHERPDGKGYPAGLFGGDIPLMARIISVADSFDAMTTTRPYRDGLSVEYALAELKRCSGSQFDPDTVDAFIRAFEAGEVLIGD